MGINKLLKKSRSSHPAIGWLYVLVALVLHTFTYLASSAFAEQPQPAKEDAPNVTPNSTTTNITVSPEAPKIESDATQSPALTDRRYVELLNEFKKLKDQLARAQAGNRPEEMSSLNAKLAEIQAKLEVLDREKKASSEITNFLKDRLQKTEEELKNVATTKEAQVRLLSEENKTLKVQADRLKYQIGQLERDQKSSAEAPTELRQRLERTEEQLRQSQLPEDQRLQQVLAENDQLKKELDGVHAQYKSQLTALEQERKASVDAANHIRDELQEAQNGKPAPKKTISEEGLDSMTDENIKLKAQVSDLQQMLREKVDQYDKEKKLNDQAAAFFKERLAKAEAQLKESAVPPDARYQNLLAKNNALREELNRVRTEFATQMDALEGEKKVLSDTSRSMADKLARYEGGPRGGGSGGGIQSSLSEINSSPSNGEAASQPDFSKPIIDSSVETPSSTFSRPPMPGDVAGSQRPVQSAVVTEQQPPQESSGSSEPLSTNFPTDGTVEERMQRVEEELKKLAKASDSRIQTLLNQNTALRADLARIRSQSDTGTGMGGADDSSLSERVAKLEADLQAMDKGKLVEAQAVNAIHERLKKAESDLNGMEATKANFDNIQSQLAELNRVKNMSAQVVGVLHQRLQRTEAQVAASTGDAEKIQQMSSQVVKVLHDRLSKAEQKLAAEESSNQLASQAMGSMNERLKKTEEELRVATTNSENVQSENSNLKDELAKLQERFDALDGGTPTRRPSSGMIARDQGEAPSVGERFARGDSQIRDLMEENERLKKNLNKTFSQVPDSEVAQDSRNNPESPRNPPSSSNSNYDRQQALIRENIELRDKVANVERLLRNASGSGDSGSLKEELSRLKTKFQASDLERGPDPTLVSPAPNSRDDVAHSYIQENNRLRDESMKERAMEDMMGGTVNNYNNYGGSDDRLFQLLLQEHDNLKRRLNEMQDSLAQIARLSGTVTLNRSEMVEPAPRAGQMPMQSVYSGTVTLLKSKGNFAIIKFPQGNVPPARSKLDVYRDGLLVGSVQITNPIKPPLASADIVSGSLRIGDEVR